MAPVAIVMGASGGLGSAVADHYAAKGWAVIAAGRNPDRIEARARAIRATGGVCESAVADVLSESQVSATVGLAVSKWGKLDVLINATGGSLSQLTGGPDRDVTELSEADFDLVVDVNLKGSFFCVKAAGLQMTRQREGCIILVASGSGLRPGTSSAAYAASKAGVIGLMKGAAKDLGPHNVRVNAVTPGLTPHGRLSDTAAGRFLDSYRAETMLGQLSTPEEFARLVAALASARYMSGQVVNLDSRVFF